MSTKETKLVAIYLLVVNILVLLTSRYAIGTGLLVTILASAFWTAAFAPGSPIRSLRDRFEKIWKRLDLNAKVSSLVLLLVLAFTFPVMGFFLLGLLNYRGLSGINSDETKPKIETISSTEDEGFDVVTTVIPPPQQSATQRPAPPSASPAPTRPLTGRHLLPRPSPYKRPKHIDQDAMKVIQLSVLS